MEFWKGPMCPVHQKWKQDGQGSRVQSRGRAAATRHGLLGRWAPQREGSSKGDGRQTRGTNGAHVPRPTIFPLTRAGGSALPHTPACRVSPDNVSKAAFDTENVDFPL